MEYFDVNGSQLGNVDEKVVVLDVTKSVEMYLEANPATSLTLAHIMAYVQRAWVLSAAKANECELIFACATLGANKQRRVMGVFQIGRGGNDGFVKSPWFGDDDRCIFLAEPANAVFREKYEGTYLTPRVQGEANPVKYNY